MLETQQSPAQNPAPVSPIQSASSLQQHTLADVVEQTGVGLHTGATTHVRVLPAAVGAGRYFVRMDIPEQPVIPAAIAAVGQTMLSTELTGNGGAVRTVEHLLSALAGMGIDNARIEIDGPEVPLLDGSAQPWVAAIVQAGITTQDAPRHRPTLTEPVWVRHEDAFVAALPSPQLRFSYGIDFPLPAIGNQWHSWSPEVSSFADEVAPARTFGFAQQIEQLRAAGLIKGGSLDNALVCGLEGWINPPLRFANEPARHKLLDLVGDMSLLGTLPIAHFMAYKASHSLHTQLVRSLTATLSPAACEQ